MHPPASAPREQVPGAGAVQSLQPFGLVVGSLGAESRRPTTTLVESVENLRRISQLAVHDHTITLYQQDRELRYVWLYPAQPGYAGVLGRTDSEIIACEGTELLTEAKRAVLLTGDSRRIEVRLPMPLGVRHYDVHIAAQRDESGAIIGVGGIAMDVSERHRAQETLRQNEERLRVTYSRAPIGIAEANLRGELVAVNDRLCKMLGYTAGELIGKSLREITHPEDTVHFYSEFLRLASGEISEYEHEKRYVSRDGRTVWVHVAASLVTDAAGRPLYCVGVILDISARKQAEESLRQRTVIVEQLHWLSSALSAELDRRKIAERALEAGRCLSGAAFGAYYAVSGSQGHEVYALERVVGFAMPIDAHPVCPDVQRVEASIGRSRVLRVADISDLPAQTRDGTLSLLPPGSPPARSFVTRAILSGSGARLGRLVFWSTAPAAIPAEADRLLETVASQVAICLDHANVYAALQRELAEHKKAEATNRRLAALVASSEDAIIGKTLDGFITSWNQGAERIFGYAAADVVGRRFMLLVPSHRVREEELILQRIQAGLRTEHFETERLHRSGRLIDISLTISPVKDLDGRIIGASSIARDVTQRKRAEQQQKALYQLVARVNRAEAMPEIFDAALDALVECEDADRASILLTDPDGLMRFKAWRGLSNSYRRAVEGHSPWAADDPSPQPLVIEDAETADLPPELQGAVRGEGIRSLVFVPVAYEKRLLGKLMIYYDAPRRIAAEELRHAETIASQVAFAIVRQQSEQALESLVAERTASLREAIAQMEEFSYSVSHDLRSPLRALLGYANVLLEDYGPQLDGQGRDYLDRIVRGGTRMDRLIQDVLTYSRITRREVEVRPLALDSFVKDLLHQIPEAQANSGCIEVHSPLHEVSAHEPLLSQALSNLVTNALKFVPPGAKPRVDIRSEVRGAGVRIWVEDQGIGIKPEYHHRLFGMFERIHPDKTYEGTGIGLAIVRKAVERMGGTVGIESDGLRGSRFWIELRGASAITAE